MPGPVPRSEATREPPPRLDVPPETRAASASASGRVRAPARARSRPVSADLGARSAAGASRTRSKRRARRHDGAARAARCSRAAPRARARTSEASARAGARSALGGRLAFGLGGPFESVASVASSNRTACTRSPRCHPMLTSASQEIVPEKLSTACRDCHKTVALEPLSRSVWGVGAQSATPSPALAGRSASAGLYAPSATRAPRDRLRRRHGPRRRPRSDRGRALATTGLRQR